MQIKDNEYCLASNKNKHGWSFLPSLTSAPSTDNGESRGVGQGCISQSLDGRLLRLSAWEIELNGGTAGISLACQFSQVIDRRRLDGVWLETHPVVSSDELLRPNGSTRIALNCHRRSSDCCILHDKISDYLSSLLLLLAIITIKYIYIFYIFILHIKYIWFKLLYGRKNAVKHFYRFYWLRKI